MNERAYQSGLERGLEGSSSAAGILEGWLESEESKKDREEGYKAGLLAAAIKGDDE